MIAGPLTEFGPDAQGFYNVFDQKNKSWPDISILMFILPFVSIEHHCYQITFTYLKYHKDFVSGNITTFLLNHNSIL